MIFPENGKECIEITKEIVKLYKQPFEKTKCNNLKKGCILSYELGELINFIVYNHVSQENGKVRDEQIYKAKERLAKMGLGDLLIQLRFLCIDNGWDIDNIQRDALNHRKERQKEIEESF